MKRMVMFAAIAAMLAAGAAVAEERFGVAVYPGAKYDTATSKSLKETMGFNGECFQTDDPVAKVMEFYRAKGLQLLGDATKEGALFRKGKVDVTIQNPWMNMKTGAMMKNTLISIVQRGE
jgi:hypothetical protein